MFKCTFTYEIVFLSSFCWLNCPGSFRINTVEEADLLERNNFDFFFSRAFNWRHVKTVLSMVTNNIPVYQGVEIGNRQTCTIKKGNLIKNDLRIRIENKWRQFFSLFYSILKERPSADFLHTFIFILFATVECWIENKKQGKSSCDFVRDVIQDYMYLQGVGDVISSPFSQ